MKYQVILEKSVAKFVDKLEKPAQILIRRALRELEDEPRPYGYKKMVDAGGLYRIRVGDFRVIYFVQDTKLIITVVRLAKRNERTY